MSVSKLESLRNEILIDIFEKYINGVDIITAFAFQLNRRLDPLIAQCRRLRFDFIRCHKDDFRFCMGLLPYYADKIEELALSEQNTPGQIHAFLAFYPSFFVFKQLRKLYFHMDLEAVEPGHYVSAPRVLLGNQLQTLSIKIKNLSRYDEKYPILNMVLNIFQMRTLKKLILAGDLDDIIWSQLDTKSSSIEYLTMRNKIFTHVNLTYIFQCAPGLKYIDIDLSFNRHPTDYRSELLSITVLLEMSNLHTAIFNTRENIYGIYKMLGHYLRCMPSLHRLEIKTVEQYSDLTRLESFLQTSLPSLAYFTLEITLSDSSNAKMVSLLESVQTPFWIEKQNFNIVLKYITARNHEQFTVGTLNALNQYTLNDSVVRWYTAPQRQLTDNMFVLDGISILSLNSKTLPFLESHYLNNVTRLVLTELNDDIFKSMIKHVNCSQIKHLDVSALKEKLENFASVLSYIRNITSLRINLNQMCDDKFACFEKNKNIICLDLSGQEHDFHTYDLSLIGQMFPNLEHLTVNTRGLENVPRLQTYLPHLRSLTFRTFEIEPFTFYDDNDGKPFDYNLRRRSNFLFQRESDNITIWIDEVALQDPYWPAPVTTNNNAQSTTKKSWRRKIGKFFFSRFKR